MHDFRAYGPGAEFWHGTALGDVNQDGFDDVAVSAPGEEMPSGGSGEVRVMSGKDGRLLGSRSAGSLQRSYGFSIAGLGDMNGDGFSDLAVGAPAAGGMPPSILGPGEVEVISGACFSVRAYCIGGMNSQGKRATLYSAGTTSVFDGTFRLGTSNLPPGQPGLFYFGDAQIQVAFGEGIRCVGGRTFRVPAFVQAGRAGLVEKQLNYAASPIAPGSTWNFQLWYRDPIFSGFNLSDAIEVTFCQ